MQVWVVSVSHEFSTRMARNVDLSRRTLKTISWNGALPAFCAWIVIIRSRKIWTGPGKSSSCRSPASWWRINIGFAFGWDFFAVNFLLNIDGIMAEDIFFSGLLFFLVRPFFFRMIFEIILDNTVKNGVPDSSGHVLSASDAQGLFGLDQLSETGTAKSMITGLDTHRNVHDLEAEGTCDLLFNRTGQTVFPSFTLLLLFFLFLSLIFCL